MFLGQPEPAAEEDLMMSDTLKNPYFIAIAAAVAIGCGI